MNTAYCNIIIKYLCFLILVQALFLFVSVSSVSAGIIGEIGDIGVKWALINIWKGLGGLALFIAGAYMMAHRRPFRYKIVAVAVALMLISMTMIGIALFIGEFWPVISEVITRTASLFD